MTTTRQNRPAPAYQEYAAAMMSNIVYRTLTLPQRGLLYAMRLECWVNKSLPAQPDILARMLGYDIAEIAAELPYVMPFFECENGQISSPELESYRAYLQGVRERQAQGGKAGAAKTNDLKRRARKGIHGGTGNPSSSPSGEPSSRPSGNCRVLSTAKSSPAQPRIGRVSTTSIPIEEVEGWSDFTVDPDADGGGA